MSGRWQASATYTLSWLYSAENQPFQGLDIVPGCKSAAQFWLHISGLLGTMSGCLNSIPASGREMFIRLDGRVSSQGGS